MSLSGSGREGLPILLADRVQASLSVLQSKARHIPAAHQPAIDRSGRVNSEESAVAVAALLRGWAMDSHVTRPSHLPFLHASSLSFHPYRPYGLSFLVHAYPRRCAHTE